MTLTLHEIQLEEMLVRANPGQLEQLVAAVEADARKQCESTGRDWPQGLIFAVVRMTREKTLEPLRRRDADRRVDGHESNYIHEVGWLAVRLQAIIDMDNEGNKA